MIRDKLIVVKSGDLLHLNLQHLFVLLLQHQENKLVFYDSIAGLFYRNSRLGHTDDQALNSAVIGVAMLQVAHFYCLLLFIAAKAHINLKQYLFQPAIAVVILALWIVGAWFYYPEEKLSALEVRVSNKSFGERLFLWLIVYASYFVSFFVIITGSLSGK